MTATDPLSFHRPPRDYPAPVPAEPLRIAAPPTEQPPIHTSALQVLMPLVGGVGLVGFALVYGNPTFLYIAGGMMVLMLLFGVGMRVSQKRGVRKRAADEARRYAKYLGERDRELAQAAELQRGALARLYPEPKRLWTQVVKRRNLWERRPGHRDFLHVRLGQGTVALDRHIELDLGMNPLAEYQKQSLHEAKRLVDRRGQMRNEPVVVDLADVGVLAVTGARERGRAWARGLMTQLAAWRAPHDLRLVTAFDPADADAWEWGKWLPHQQADPGAPASGGLLLARSPSELESMLEGFVRPRTDQLRRLADADAQTQRSFSLTAPELVVILDGWTPQHPINGGAAFKELMARARELKAVLVLLIDDRALEPSSIDARLSIPERGTA